MPITIDKGITTKELHGLLLFLYAKTSGSFQKELSRYTNKYFSELNKNTEITASERVGLKEQQIKRKMQADDRNLFDRYSDDEDIEKVVREIKETGYSIAPFKVKRNYAGNG